MFKANEKKEIMIYALLSFILIAVILSAYLYQILSGGYAEEILKIVFIVIVLAYICNFICKIIQNNKIKKMAKPAIMSITVNVFYEQNENKENTKNIYDANLNIFKTNKNSYVINVQVPDKDFNGIADVKIVYNCNPKDTFLRKLNINEYVYVKDITLKSTFGEEYIFINYNIPNKSDGIYIPVTILKGQGFVEILGYPEDNTKFKINEAKIENILDDIYKYCYASKSKNVESNIIYIDKTKENDIILESVKEIKIGDITRKVEKSIEEDKFIKLELDGEAKEFEYPNCFEVIK